jgi:endonuclease III
MKPPYEITSEILRLTSSISEKIGEIKSAKLIKPPTELRKRNRIKSIQSSLEIEGNTLNVEQITDLINNKRVLAPQKDIIEVKNAIELYSKLNELNTYDINSLCRAHGILMNTLIENAGEFRRTAVGIKKGNNITHIAPPGDIVYPLMTDLFDYLKNDNDILLIKSCVFHYEFEFIHPFIDGNGRMGRLWQTLILNEYSPVFEYLPIESLIKERQQDYYNVLEKSDNQGKSTEFIEFMLRIINIALEDLLKTQNHTLTSIDRISVFKSFIGNELFTRQDYLRHNKQISTATASRDLKEAVDNEIIVKEGDKRLTKYRYKSFNFANEHRVSKVVDIFEGTIKQFNMQPEMTKSLELLMKQYLNRKHPLDYQSRYQLLVMVILSAQDSDKNINGLAPAFFEAYPTINSLVDATAEDLHRYISKVRNFGNKANWIVKLAQMIGDDDNIPTTMSDLTKLPGIGRKSANVIMREAGKEAEGVIVDLHVVRVAPRIGIATGTQPEKIEKQLMTLVPQKYWGQLGMAISFLGREICRPTNPKCDNCVMSSVCHYHNGISENEENTSGLKLF